MAKGLRIIGIDEAGRGSLIGPLVVAGVSATDVNELLRLGVRDSKLLSKKRREELFHMILSIPGVKVKAVIISPRLIDAYVRNRTSGGLNALEAKAMARIIDCLPGTLAVVDAASVNEAAFGADIISRSKKRIALISSHYADKNYAVVSAASIIAKVTRDKRIEMLQSLYGDFGSGYPSDPITREFIERMGRAAVFTSAVRASWKTLKRLQLQ